MSQEALEALDMLYYNRENIHFQQQDIPNENVTPERHPRRNSVEEQRNPETPTPFSQSRIRNMIGQHLVHPYCESEYRELDYQWKQKKSKVFAITQFLPHERFLDLVEYDLTLVTNHQIGKITKYQRSSFEFQ